MTDTNEKPVQQPERVFAFWKYDLFPYVQSDAGVQISDTAMRLDHFGNWGMGSMFAFQPVELGAATKKKLQTIEAEYREEQSELLAKYKAKALEILPALAVTKSYGGRL